MAEWLSMLMACKALFIASSYWPFQSRVMANVATTSALLGANFTAESQEAGQPGVRNHVFRFQVDHLLVSSNGLFELAGLVESLGAGHDATGTARGRWGRGRCGERVVDEMALFAGHVDQPRH